MSTATATDQLETDQLETARLRDGTSIALRPLRDGEAQPVLDVFAGMSARSRYLRFLSPIRELSPGFLRQLTRLDDANRLALLATSAGRAVGEVRFARLSDDPTTADLAISVIDEFHGRGLGRLLMAAAAALASERGLTTFTLTVHPENPQSLGLMRSLGARFRFIDGTYEGRLPVASALLAQIPRQRAA
jgi:ribosomal protein S18 acetylase RimI-like enzyme